MRTVFLFIVLFVFNFLWTACPTPQQTVSTKSVSSEKIIDWQGHRGVRGLMPENSIPGFLKALEFKKVTTLELDVVISADSQAIVSHEPWFSENICNDPFGEPISKEQAETLLIYKMTYEEIKNYDCGSRGNKRFAEQQKLKTYKPALLDVITNVDLHCEKTNRKKPGFNIELKSRPEWYDKQVPNPERFVQLVLHELDLLKIKDRVSLQSFDVNILQEIRRQDKEIPVVFLVENMKSIDKNLELLGYTPDIYSPHYGLLNESRIEKLHAKNIKIIPWTVNDTKTMKKLVDQGVDGIITDYPNLIP